MRLALISALVFIASCSHNCVDRGSTSLLGKWKMTSSAISIGGPATWQDADPDNPSYVEFIRAGKIIFTDKNSKSSFDYNKTEEGKFSVTGNNLTVTYWYTLEGNELTLNGGGCIEQCSRKYKKVNGSF